MAAATAPMAVPQMPVKWNDDFSDMETGVGVTLSSGIDAANPEYIRLETAKLLVPPVKFRVEFFQEKAMIRGCVDLLWA